MKCGTSSPVGPVSASNTCIFPSPLPHRLAVPICHSAKRYVEPPHRFGYDTCNWAE